MASTALPSPVEEPRTGSAERVRDWSLVSHLKVRLSVQLPIRPFTVRRLLELAPQMVLLTEQPTSAAVPLCANEHVLAYVEFQAGESELDVRLSRLA